LSWRIPAFPILLHGFFVPVNCFELLRHAQRALTEMKNEKPFMKAKIILMMLAALAGASTMWFAPGHLFAQTNVPPAVQKILYHTCLMHPAVKSDHPGQCPECGMGLEPVYAGDAATNTAASSTTNKAAVKPYPLDYCLVSGDKIGAMGKPIVTVFQGQEIKFCCPDCPPEFKKNPDKYMKKLKDAEAAAKKKKI
jgi:YHS domain-containing protein